MPVCAPLERAGSRVCVCARARANKRCGRDRGTEGRREEGTALGARRDSEGGRPAKRTGSGRKATSLLCVCVCVCVCVAGLGGRTAGEALSCLPVPSLLFSTAGGPRTGPSRSMTAPLRPNPSRSLFPPGPSFAFPPSLLAATPPPMCSACTHVLACLHARTRVRACVHTCVRACVCVCVCERALACVRASVSE